jgi:hypothetical protein
MQLSVRRLWAFSTAVALAVAILAIGLPNVLGLRATNILVSTSILVQGAAVLLIMWRLETRVGSIPFASCYFFFEHLAFGFGGFLVSVFGQNYYYENANGIFPWDAVVIGAVYVHAVAINIGLIGVWLATKRVHVRAISRYSNPWNSWRWEESRYICYGALILHFFLWEVLQRFKLGFVTYLDQAIIAHTHAAFLLWGLAWNRCRAKWVFLAYAAIYGLLEAIKGARGNFIFPALLFGIGILISDSSRFMKLRTAILWAPVGILIFIGITKSEDVRIAFARGEPANFEDAMARIESLTSGNSDALVLTDPLGQAENAPFRVGSRVFELSAGDVILRTPESVPFWGWTEEDMSIFLTGFLPLKLNSDAAYNSSATAGVLFLQSYGWTQVDPTLGNSMPATMIGDSWRRFGWYGVIGWFFFWSWFLATLTRILRCTPKTVFKTLVATALAANLMVYYDLDMIYASNSLPRSLVTMAGYALILWAWNRMFSGGFAEYKRPSMLFPTASPVASLADSRLD